MYLPQGGEETIHLHHSLETLFKIHVKVFNNKYAKSFSKKEINAPFQWVRFCKYGFELLHKMRSLF